MQNDNIINALRAVEKGMSISAAAKTYDINKGSLSAIYQGWSLHNKYSSYALVPAISKQPAIISAKITTSGKLIEVKPLAYVTAASFVTALSLVLIYNRWLS